MPGRRSFLRASLWGLPLIAAGIAGGALAASSPVSERKERGGAVGLDPLFDVELQYKGQIEFAPLGEKEGKLVGGGDGTVRGDRVSGTVVRWSNFEQTLQEGRVCAIQVPVEIRTRDGAEIRFEARGHAIVPDETRPTKWRSVTALRFQTQDKRYQWLNGTLAVWDGDFDLETGRLRARVYARPGEMP